MKRSVRIVDGVCKVVHIDKKGKIVDIVGDHKKLNIDENKIIDYEKHATEYERRAIEIQKRYEEIELECIIKEREIKEKITEQEELHEIHHGKRHKYQRKCIVKDISEDRKRALKNKVYRGIIEKTVFDIKSSKELLNDWARKRGFYDYGEYLNIIALGRGFTCYDEYVKVWKYYPGIPSPIKEDRMDNRFLGIYIGENAINKIFEGSKRMRPHNPGYDILCPKGYKIDVKATVLSRYNTYIFDISKNKTADYFVMIGFNNIIDLEPLHLWIIGGNEKLHTGTTINDKNKLVILNEPLYLEKYEKYEKIDNLESLKILCNEFDAKNKIATNEYNIITRHSMIDTICQIRSNLRGNVSHTDILLALEKKKNGALYLKVIPEEDTR